LNSNITNQWDVNRGTLSQLLTRARPGGPVLIIYTCLVTWLQPLAPPSNSPLSSPLLRTGTTTTTLPCLLAAARGAPLLGESSSRRPASRRLRAKSLRLQEDPGERFFPASVSNPIHAQCSPISHARVRALLLCSTIPRECVARRGENFPMHA
jgi:hypothetical protein